MGGLDDTGVTGGAGGADGVVWACDVEVEGDFASWVICDGSGVMVVGPEFGIVVKLGDVEDFVFGFDVTVFGDAEVDADAIFLGGGPVEVGVFDGFVGAVDGDGACSGAVFDGFTILVDKGVVVAEACEDLADVAHLGALDIGDAVNEIGAEFG